MAYQDLSQFKLPPNFRGGSPLKVQLWWLVQSTLFRWSPQVLYPWRSFLLRLFGAKIGKKCVIRPTVVITYPWFVEIEDYAWIGDDVTLYSLDKIHVGKHAVVSQKSYLCGGGHDYTSLDFKICKKPIFILEEVWIATDVFIGPGVTVGKGAVVGARSSVYKDLEGEKVYAGNPAKYIKDRMMLVEV